MFCIKCGTPLEDNYDFCPKCGAPVYKEAESKAKAEYVETFIDEGKAENVVYEEAYNGGNAYVQAYPDNYRNKWISILLCLFLGVLGAHRFYEGKIGTGILYLFTGGIVGIGVIVDFIILLGKPTMYPVY